MLVIASLIHVRPSNPAFLSWLPCHRDSLETKKALLSCFIHIFLEIQFLWLRQHKKMRHKGDFSQGLESF